MNNTDQHANDENHLIGNILAEDYSGTLPFNPLINFPLIFKRYRF